MAERKGVKGGPEAMEERSGRPHSVLPQGGKLRPAMVRYLKDNRI